MQAYENDIGCFKIDQSYNYDDDDGDDDIDKSLSTIILEFFVVVRNVEVKSYMDVSQSIFPQRYCRSKYDWNQLIIVI